MGGGYRSHTAPPKPPPNMNVKRDFYTGYPIRNSYSFDEVEAYRAKEAVIVRGSHVPPPMLSFHDYAWPEYISAGVARLGYERPTPIQAQGWPIALAGRDMVSIAQTGSGKTISFILPAFVHIDSQLSERRGKAYSFSLEEPFSHQNFSQIMDQWCSC